MKDLLSGCNQTKEKHLLHSFHITRLMYSTYNFLTTGSELLHVTSIFACLYFTLICNTNVSRNPQENDVKNDTNGKYHVSDAGKCTCTQFVVTFQLPNLSLNPAVPPAAEPIPNSVNFEQDQISLHLQELLPEHVGDLNNQENFDPSSCQVVTLTELNRVKDRQQKISELFDQSLVSLSHQSKKRTTS